MNDLADVSTNAAQRTGRRVFVIETMTSPSGAPIAALRLADGLAATGWNARVTFLYMREEMNQVDYPYECLLPHSPRGPFDYARIGYRLFRLLRRERPDVIIGFLPFASVTGAVAGLASGARVRMVSHRVPFPTYRPIMRWLDTVAARTGLYTDVVSVSGSVSDSCWTYPARMRPRMTVVYNGLRGWRSSPLGKREARERLGLPVDAMIVASVGRLDFQKNFPLLISAMAEAPETCIAAIAGEGPLRDELAAQAARLGVADRVRFLGALPRGEVPHLLASADVFAQTSTFEGQSNALLEALHAGLPCLVGDVPEQVETVRSEQGDTAGAILPLDDPAAWADAIVRFSTDGEDRRRAIDVAAERARAFSYDRMIGSFNAVLSTALARK